MKDLLEFVNSNSKFYQKLWQGRELSLEALPVVDQTEFWDANTWKENKLLTDTVNNGVVFKSGGTTGRPKFSIFTKQEWEEFTKIFGRSMSSVVEQGDRIANLFYAGELYASFLFIEKSLEYCPVDTITFPIAGATDLNEVEKLIEAYDINVLAGVPTSFLRLAQNLIDNNKILPLKKLLYGGESLFDDQKAILNQAFDNPKIESIGYASVDAGHLGGSAPKLGPRVHTVLAGTIMQIVDENDELINDTSRTGRLLMTNLTRKLMPIIRYPVGDMARWNVVNESFEILGRADEGARVGPVTINRDDIVNVFNQLGTVVTFQLVVKRELNKDKLLIRYQGAIEEDKALEMLLKSRPMLVDSVEKNIICAPEFEKVSELERNPRTGKLKLVIDERF